MSCDTIFKFLLNMSNLIAVAIAVGITSSHSEQRS